MSLIEKRKTGREKMADTARKPQTKDQESDDLTERKEGEEGDSETKSAEDKSEEEQSRYLNPELPRQSASGVRRTDHQLFIVREGHIHSGWHERAEAKKRITIMDRVKQSLKAHLRKKFTCIHEGASASQSRLEDVYTRLYITQQTADYGCGSHEILDQFKFQHDKPSFFIEDYEQISCLNIFKSRRKISQKQSGMNRPIRTVMTKGMAGIGKTVTVQKFSLNWAEGQSNQHIDFLFVLPFRELNLLKDGEYSLLQLLVPFYPELDSLENMQDIAHTQVLLVFDGLDESRFALDFVGSARVTEVTQQSTVPVLLTNLIRGTLLPNALLWVTSRPAAASQIPSQYIDQVTEVQGFTDDQKVEYFKKRFSADQAKEVLSCLSGMLSFHFMGHMPIFCWITAEVFREGWSDRRSRKITTMTELYIYYLQIQTQRAKQKYGKRSSVKAEEKEGKSGNAALLLNLSRLAFEQLLKGNLIFYEEDLRECDIDTDDAAVFCGFCSEILTQERGLYQRKIFSFVHLSFQEFLAALYTFHSCVTRNDNALKLLLSVEPTDMSLLELQKRVVDKALQSENGQLDMFLCFFLGFLLQSNQTILEDLLSHTKSSSDTADEMKSYLRTFNVGNISQERCMNLFICKFELSEERFQDDIKLYLDSGVRLSSVDCSVLSTLLQLSGEVIDDLDLTKCYTPLVGTEKLVQLMMKCKRAALKSQHLKDNCLHILISILHSADSCLRELSLVCVQSANVPLPYDLVVLGDSKLETLRLSGYSLGFQWCHSLASILQFKQSSLKALDLNDCIYSYPQHHSGYQPEEVEKTEEYEDFNDELTLLTVIPAALIGPICPLEEFSMTGCHLKSKCCQVFASVLCSNSNLRVLDLSRNNLQDLGVQLLSVGLGSSKCRLEILRLSCCGVTEEGCVFLASALKSNPSHLRELDLSYNYPGKSGVELLSERLQDPECRMEKLNVDQNEEHWVNPQLLHKYACDVTLDSNTVNEHLLLSEHNRKVDRTKEKQSYPDHPERFDDVQQVMSVEGLTGRCYWEVEWTGFSNCGVAYKSLKRKGHEDATIEYSSKAWTFNMNVWNGYSFFHMRKETFVPIPIVDVKAFLSRRRRLGLFLDWPAGLLSFYSLCGDTKTLLHTFHTTFTEPVHPVFTVVAGSLTLTSAAKLKKDGAASSFTPEVVTEKMCVSYRFTFPSSGLFQCSLTGLVFKVTDKGEVHYKTQIWDPLVLEAAGKVPGGPLFSIKTSQNLICQLHLPHCEPEPALVSESLSVVHITEDGMSIIKPREITQTHAVVDTAHLSAFGLVWDIVKRFVNLVTQPVNGQVLLFLRPSYRGGNLILRVILLPGNVPLLEVKAHHEDCENIPAPSYCLLHKEQYYSLLSDPEGFRIQPRRTRFFENYGPNFHASFEVTLATSTEEVTLLVQDPDRMQQVWEYSLPLPASPSPASTDEHESGTRKKTSAEEKLQRTRTQFVERVSDPVLDKLLDELQSHGVLHDSECEAYRVKSKSDKARSVIDTVRKKGEHASSTMIKILSKNDPYLCKELEFG